MPVLGGVGGANTNSGLRFERDTDLLTALAGAGYQIRGNEVWHQTQLVARTYKGFSFYREMLEPHGIRWQDRISSQLLPDESIVTEGERLVTVLEKKWQQRTGSVDEKLQTGAFKLRQYRRLTNGLNLRVQYVYVLNDWFRQPRYRDTLEYVVECGCDYYFTEVPADVFGL